MMKCVLLLTMIFTATAASRAATIAATNASQPFVPAAIHAERIFRGPRRVATPATWNAHLPKLTADDRFLYAVHTHYPAGVPVSERFAVILRRPRHGGAWTEVARFQSIHQPPGIAFDRGGRLHMVIDCLRSEGQPSCCFRGRVETGRLQCRFYHLVFGTRDAAGAIRFDTFANADEWTAESNGYHGLAVDRSGGVYWSLAAGDWRRIIQGARGTQRLNFATAARSDAYYLYPVHLPLSDGRLLTFVSEFDPAGGTNAANVRATLLLGTATAQRPLARRAPRPIPRPGQGGAFPCDLDLDIGGTLLALAHRVDRPAGTNTELWRFDRGIDAPPTVLPVGQATTYCTLQVNRHGVYYVLAGGAAGTFRLAVSGDHGEHWTWHAIPVEGLDGTEQRLESPTPIAATNAPMAYDPDMMRFFFAGANAAGYDSSYYGEMAVARSRRP